MRIQECVVSLEENYTLENWALENGSTEMGRFQIYVLYVAISSSHMQSPVNKSKMGREERFSFYLPGSMK